MTTSEHDPISNHRMQRGLLAGLSLLALLLAVAPRQERALFITQAVGLKAFAAAVPPIDYAALARIPNFVDDVAPRGFFARVPGRPVGGAPGLPGVPAADEFGPASPFVPSDAVADGGQGPVLQDAVLFTNPAAPGSAFPFIPVGLAPPSASPSGPIEQAAAVPSEPAVTPAPSTTVTPTPTPPSVTPTSPTSPTTPTPGGTTPVPVEAVPEPTTWALMILGFFAVGTTLRRGRRRSAGRTLCAD